jgi:hypothetical protein
MFLPQIKSGFSITEITECHGITYLHTEEGFYEKKKSMEMVKDQDGDGI